MQNANRNPYTQASASKRSYSLFRASASLLTMATLLVPGLAIADNASNNAVVTLPSGIVDPNSSSNSFTDTDNVSASALVAGNDAVSGVNGASGATAVANAFASDTLNGVSASPSNATLSVTTGTTVPTALTFNTVTGAVDVVSGTAAGTYVVNYTICDDQCDCGGSNAIRHCATDCGHWRRWDKLASRPVEPNHHQWWPGNDKRSDGSRYPSCSTQSSWLASTDRRSGNRHRHNPYRHTGWTLSNYL
jgi:hypothetical protein